MEKKVGRGETYLLLFPARFDAILAHRLLLSAGSEAKLLPVPRTLSASCGVCVEFPWPEDRPIPTEVLQKVQIEALFRREGEGWAPVEVGRTGP